MSYLKQKEKKYIMTGYTGSVGTILSKEFKYIEHIDINKNFIDIDVFLHLAASTNKKNIINSNINYLEQSIEFCFKNKIRNFVFFSSVSIYGKQNSISINENWSGNELSLYGISKLFGETYLKNQNLNILILRLPAILTKKDNTYISSLLTSLKNNETITLKNYNKNFNNFIGIDDIVKFIKKYNFSKPYEVLNFASSQQQSLRDIVLYLHKKINSKSKIVYNDERSDFYNLSIDKLTNEYKFCTNYLYGKFK